MPILITRHTKVFFKKIYLSNIEHGVMTSKTPFFYHFCLGNACLEFVLKLFFYKCNANTDTDKSSF